ncbi:MAG TPA: TOBE domain-containing protein [Fibrobacteraceae bacterium]|nr:TOBE domain-containing protein [Fibrobacteraceae bacterium]
MRLPSSELLPIEVDQIRQGIVNAQVDAHVLRGTEIRIVITREAMDNLKLQPGMRAYAILGESNHPLCSLSGPSALDSSNTNQGGSHETQCT